MAQAIAATHFDELRWWPAVHHMNGFDPLVPVGSGIKGLDCPTKWSTRR